jgi:nucleotide-binding universal stress UspA family protein
MTKIIVPIDFSKSSENALKYAYQLAKVQNKVIKLLHAYHPVSVDIDGVSIVDPHVENIKRKQLKQLSFKKKQLEELDSTLPYVDEEFKVGFAVEEIVELSNDDHTDMIVMGSTGRGSTIKKWFGSVSLEVLKKAKAPVLIVPPSAEFKGIKNVLYATDNPMVDSMVLEMLSEIIKPFDIKLHLVHVKDHKASASDHVNILRLLDSFYKPDQLAYSEVSGDDIANTIDVYARHHKIDLIVMTRKKRTLLEGLLKPSVTTKMAIHTTLPLLVFHEGVKVCNCGGACKKKAQESPTC